MAGGGNRTTDGPSSSSTSARRKTKAGGGGGGGDGGIDPCELKFDTNVYSPDPSVLAKVSVGQSINIILVGKVVAVTVPALKNARLGTLAGVKVMATLVKCLQNGVIYEGKITKIVGGAVDISVWRNP